MAELAVHRILLLVISLTKCLEGTKLLAELKKCGDLECETLISRVVAMRDYTGPDCLFLNFTKGEEISVYAKLAGQREDLWAGSKGKNFGFFPRDAVQIEEVFISEEVEISTKESDFLCLLGASYIFENKDREFNSHSGENMYPYEEEQKYSIYGSDFQIESEFYAISEGQFPTSESSEDIRNDWEEAKTGSVKQDHVPEVDHISSPLTEVQGWFGLRKEHGEENPLESVIEPVQGSSFQSRKITGGDENNLEELNNGEPRTEHKREPESEFDSVPKQQLALALESEHVLKPQANGWFGGEFTSKSDHNNEQEIKMIKTMETEDQIDKEKVLEKTDDSYTIAYFTKLFYNFDNPWSFQNIPKETELPFPKQILDQSNMVENNEREEFSGENDPRDNMKDLTMLKNRYYQSDMIAQIKLPMKIHEEVFFETSSKNDEKSKPSVDFEGSAQVEIDRSMENPLLNSQMVLTDSSLSSQNYIPLNENATEFQILKYIFQINVYEFVNSALSLVIILTERVVEALPEDMRPGPNPYGLPWELVICAAIGFLAIFLFLWRSFKSVRSRLYMGREKKLALKLSGLIKEKCELLEKISLFQKEYEGLESSLKDTSFEKESTEAQSLEATYEKLDRSKSKLEDEILFLEKELKEEKSKHSEQDELMADISKRIQSLEDESKSLKSQIAEAKTTLKIFQMNEERLKVAMKEALNENSQLQEGQKQLLQEAEVWKEQVSDLNKQKITFEESKVHAEQVLNDKENHIKSLIECLLKMEDWGAVLGEDLTDDGNLELEMNSESEVGAYLDRRICEPRQATSLSSEEISLNPIPDVIKAPLTYGGLLHQVLADSFSAAVHCSAPGTEGSLRGLGTSQDNQPKGALKKVVYAAKLNASLKTLEGERNQIYTQLSEVDKTKEDLTEHIKNLQTEQASLQSEYTQFESENQKLQQKLKVMTELYQENEMKLHRKLTVEENYRLEKEEKLSKVDEKISRAAEELETYRKRAKDLEEELERTIHCYQGQIISHEKKAHDNWLAARAAERNLNDLRKENAHNRQKLTETEFKFELLEKDPYALDVPNTTFGREHSPYGASPLGQPSSERRAFLSPPTLLEGPLRLSPLLPGGGGRGSRGPENPLDHQISNERGESSHDRLTDPHRAPSDTGSLSPPWEQDRRMMIPPPDGPMSLEMESSTNDTKDDLDNSNVPDSSLPAENQATGSRFGFSPLPPIRGPLFPVDPRSHFMRRGPSFPPPPPPPGNMYGASRDYFLPGPPPPPFPMRNAYSPRGFPHYLPPRAGFFPSPPHSESRSEFPSGLIPPSNEPATEHPEPQQET
ncbi:melanoma inhibitory activity protein 2 isoform X3 [Marmota marmota marmota]|uniref:melanoma inhibitory activity protein 2 isoform X3 n=1 Tax=Marmota marmota marmota TaxID=9994 RepID=UPI0020927FFC|nr:melanoma inhibitory activity protein 2 isoform X3 [Marmota marmota marmota]